MGASPPLVGRVGGRTGGGLAPPSLFSFTLKFEHMAKNILKSNIFGAIYFQRDLLSANIWIDLLQRDLLSKVSTFSELSASVASKLTEVDPTFDVILYVCL